jgi:hypothetical protein
MCAEVCAQAECKVIKEPAMKYNFLIQRIYYQFRSIWQNEETGGGKEGECENV